MARLEVYRVRQITWIEAEFARFGLPWWAMTDPKPDPAGVATDFDPLDAEPEPALGAHRAYLIVTRESGGRDVIDLVEGSEVTVGRIPECTVSVDDTRVSRRHVRIARDGSQITVEDLGS